MTITLSKSLKCKRKMFLLVTACLAQMAAHPIEAATWKKPVLLSVNDASHPDTAIDNQGNVISVWVDKPATDGTGQIWTKVRRNGVWSTSTALDIAIDNHNPVVEISATGNATAVWNNSSGIWSANRPAGKGWTVPKLLVPSSVLGRSKFSMNSKGDALLTWTVGNYYGSSVNYMKRPAGSGWSLPGVIATYVNPFVIGQGGDGVDMIESVIGENGDALTAWTSYGIHPHGYKGAQQLKVSRLAKTGTTWQTSPAWGTLDPFYYKPSLLLDAQGRAGVVFNTPDATAINYNWVIAKQARPGQAWSAPAIIPIDNADTTCNSLMTLPDIVGCWKDHSSKGSARSDADGNITFMYSDLYGYYDSWDGTYYARRGRSITSNLGSVNWSTPATLLAYDDSSNYWSYGTPLGKYDVGANGTSVFAWPWYDATTLSPLLKVKLRAGATGTFKLNLSYNFNTPNNLGNVLDVKVNAIGNASIVYDNFDSVNHQLYVVTYN